MSTGADPKTMPGTPEFRDGYDRIFGDRKPVRGTFVYDKRLGRCVPIEEYQPEETPEARCAPIMVDRFMEGAQATDGTDIGSRRKRREYMKREGVTDKSDYRPDWGERVRKAREQELSKVTRETVARIAYTDPRWKP